MKNRTSRSLAFSASLLIAALSFTSAPAASAQALGSLELFGNPSPTKVSEPTYPGPDPQYTGSIDQAELIKATNDYRIEHGLRPLTVNAKFNYIAQTWAEQLAKDETLRHNPSYSKGFPKGWKLGGENVLQNWCWASADALVQQWHESPSHRENLQNPAFNTIGVGIAYGADGRVWAVQNFGEY